MDLAHRKLITPASTDSVRFRVIITRNCKPLTFL